MAWYPIVGYGAFWIGLVVAIILFATKRRWYPVTYLISVCLYVFTICFIIDVYNVPKNGILGLLALSAVIMIGLGLYLSKRFKKGKR